MNVVLLAVDQPAQRALAHRIAAAEGVTLAGVVVQSIPSTASWAWVRQHLRRDPRAVASKIAQRVLFEGALRDIARTEMATFGIDGRARPWPDIARSVVTDINAAEVVSFLHDVQPDLIAVSGTRLVKQPVFDVRPRFGLLNLHTGLSPYYRGGPNCTLWCLANHEPEFIGVTVHELDLGVDSGPILKTARTPIDRDDTVARLVTRTLQVGHDAYVDVIEAIARGERRREAEVQSLTDGRTYRNRDWTVWQFGRAVGFVRRGGLRSWSAERAGTSDVRTVDVFA